MEITLNIFCEKKKSDVPRILKDMYEFIRFPTKSFYSGGHARIKTCVAVTKNVGSIRHSLSGILKDMYIN